MAGVLGAALFLTAFGAMALFVLLVLDYPHDWIMATIVMATVVVMFVVQMKNESRKTREERM